MVFILLRKIRFAIFQGGSWRDAWQFLLQQTVTYLTKLSKEKTWLGGFGVREAVL
jgi:hypothetical protein